MLMEWEKRKRLLIGQMDGLFGGRKKRKCGGRLEVSMDWWNQEKERWWKVEQMDGWMDGWEGGGGGGGVGEGCN